jgi:hypothetical protein
MATLRRRHGLIVIVVVVIVFGIIDDKVEFDGIQSRRLRVWPHY